MQTRTEERWGVIASAPPVRAAEIETREAAVEVVVMWGQSVLHVEHLSPPRTLRLDEALGGGAGRRPIVVERGGELRCVIPAGASGAVTGAGGSRDLEELREAGALLPFEEVEGASLYPLPEGATLRFTYEGLTFLVRPTRAGKAPAAPAPIAWRRHAWIAVSLGVHALLIGMFYLLPPSSRALSLDTISPTDRMVRYVDPAPETTEPDEVEWAAGEAPDEAGDPGRAHEGDEGQSGRPESTATGRRFAIQGDPEERDPALARSRIAERMDSVGAIGALATLMGRWDVPTSPYGADQPRGSDPLDAIGALMGESLGESFGSLGLGMRSTGRGAGGDGRGTLGVGPLGTLGSCSGRRCGRGDGTSYGERAGRLGGRRGIEIRTPRRSAVVHGGLSREAIRRVVRRNLPQVRHCYEQGLMQNPSIEGRVQVSWIISPTGAVQGASVSSSTVRSREVEQCIARAVTRWSFPRPDGGALVSVNYPFVLQSL